MPADELGRIWSSEPVRVTQSVRSLGKEHDTEEKDHDQEAETPEREFDSFEPSNETKTKDDQSITINAHTHTHDDDAHIPGSNIDVTVG